MLCLIYSPTSQIMILSNLLNSNRSFLVNKGFRKFYGVILPLFLNTKGIISNQGRAYFLKQIRIREWKKFVTHYFINLNLGTPKVIIKSSPASTDHSSSASKNLESSFTKEGQHECFDSNEDSDSHQFSTQDKSSPKPQAAKSKKTDSP